ncbi:Manganese-dependent ADP-ribose/CDP-alcohol diphosphatase [Hibiscus syriacus]|uniref:Manganese-dependent ADP-ribose/CDP-alcohol diphosphatase n=1 Tax=Hibiscus syriacus TaxID=106335 RepID=A0A6A3AU92_HIBSY|nr:Manganese-dependent ADP-ribose/CDP-alcohol diphosphatase [Hibiscus syriacus]
MDLATGVANGQGRHPIFSFGVIADVQYADIPDGHSFLGVRRYYRHSILVLQRAVKSWNDCKNLNFVINFGDIVDGKCPKDQSLDAVKKVVGEYPIMAVVMPTRTMTFHQPQVIDLLYWMDMIFSAIGWPIDHPNTLEAMKVLNEKNPNSNKNSPEGLEGVDRRFVMFNGAVGKEQMEWLNSVLQDATNMEQKVIVCCHLPLDPGATSKTTLLWNYDQVMDVIHRYDCVKVCLSGHNHEGGYSIDSHGVHHRVLDAALECPPGTDAFGYIDVYDNMLSLVGTDRLENTDFSFDS